MMLRVDHQRNIQAQISWALQRYRTASSESDRTAAIQALSQAFERLQLVNGALES